ncbi:prolyl oligopeptidase family serine peptidase [Hymenobacter sp. HMF4947]|uniref:Prolyl oligopeptidase family serine peptidase n=1 Tax=Hymenobacter ginkgonis TaxID=2682976 RepID=A0A7K1T9W0_9BACT|nr:S9 family peptidase [Hymenobacter ginkgonis]MVN74951.1 prolyl oligopeptidase family serine peptidase [Hymenobacter ginkgonis]
MIQHAVRHAGATLALLLTAAAAQAQVGPGTQWTKDGYGYLKVQQDEIVQLDARKTGQAVTILSKQQLTPAGQTAPLKVRRFAMSDNGKLVLLNTNTKKVWRYDTRGDYWVYNLGTNKLVQLGKGRPESSLMFAKFSPDGSKVAYVSEHNLYVENLADNRITQLTTDGTDKLINGTFDWVYEEELDCRDGFRWAPNGQSLAYWQLDATKTRNYLMLNTTDQLYPYTVPVEYPVVGEDPSRARIGVVPVAGGATKWMDIPGDAVQHYLPRMEWAGPSELIVQQLNRRQNESNIILANASTGAVKAIFSETDKAWIDAKDPAVGWNWINKGQSFVWASEKDGWRHLYSIDRTGKEKLLTPGNYDVISLENIDEVGGEIYFMASPTNATQTYLYHVPLKGGSATRLTPMAQAGWHNYDISPNGKIALHTYSSAAHTPVADVVSLPAHQRLSGGESPTPPAGMAAMKLPKTEFFQVKTADGVTLDGWMVKPTNFDPKKKYPIVFYVYGEPASQTVTDRVGTGLNRLYQGNMADDGYIYASLENRGAPAPRGREFRKAIYHNIGALNIRDQAMGAKEVLKNSFVDTSRVAVWGWSGGGSSTLNLMFQYPQIYKTGISIAAVDNQLNYDNIYQERYMGLVPEDKHFFVDNSPLAHAKNLRGNLLLVHGTGDDNVHYNNAEQMINELVKDGKTFQLMSYPNRTHSISEGEGTSRHLAATYTKFLKENCPPGGR